MKIRIIQIGKDKDSWVSESGAEFVKRLAGFCDLEIVTLKEVRQSKTFNEQRCVLDEGEQILKSVKDGEVLVVLDEVGRQMDSKKFAGFVEGYKNQGVSLTFVIGGPFGLSPAVKARADILLSFSKMTFTHQMIRIFLLEQIYRAFSIISGKEYHH